MMMLKKFISPCSYKKKLSEIRPQKSAVLIYDKILLSNKSVADFVKNFPVAIGLESGENLKTLKSLECVCQDLLEKINEVALSQISIYSLGGGSIGDFSGFLASVLFRGVPLFHVPTTWLAAIDSSHGGKTALNVGAFKNQLGSFYPAQKVYLVKEILMGQSDVLARQAMSEAWKISVIDGSAWAKKFLFSKKELELPVNVLLWKYLKFFIAGKYRIVSRDPFEKKGLRKKLNLGHTLGHAMELSLNLSHGEAVAWGLVFSLHVSLLKNKLKRAQYKSLYQSLHEHVLKYLPNKNPWKRLSSNELKEALLRDKKKISSSALDFVVIGDIAKVEIIKVSIEELIQPLYAHEI
jgi:3-dehydroquinate synthase